MMDTKNKINIKKLITLFAVLLVVLRVVFCLTTQFLSDYWNQTEGTITNSYEYVYTANDKTYKNHIVEYRPQVFGNQLVDDKKKYSPGKKVTVYYSPMFPQISMLTTVHSGWAFLAWLGALLFVGIIWISISFSSSSSNYLDDTLKQMGFKVNKNEDYFGEYKIEDASDDFSNFFLFGVSKGSADFSGWPSAVIEKEGRFIELTRNYDYDNYRNKEFLELKVETSWTTYLDARHDEMHGVVHSQLETTQARLEIEEISFIYLRKQSNEGAQKNAQDKRAFMVSSSTDARGELLVFEKFKSGNADFDDYFGIQMGSYRVQYALSAQGARNIVDSLKAWNEIIYDVIVDDDNVKIRISIKKLRKKSLKLLEYFAKIFPQLLEDAVKFTKRLEDALFSYQFDFKEHFEVKYDFVTISATIKCKNCNARLPLNGAIEEIVCEKCGNINTLEKNRFEWGRIFYSPYYLFEKKHYTFSRDYLEGSNIVSLKWEVKGVVCKHCNTRISKKILEKLPKDERYEFLCPNCQGVNISAPAPDWVREISPFMDLIINGQTDNDEQNNQSITPWSVRYAFKGDKLQKIF